MISNHASGTQLGNRGYKYTTTFAQVATLLIP